MKQSIKAIGNQVAIILISVSIFLIQTSVSASSVHVVTKQYLDTLKEAINPQILTKDDDYAFPLITNPNQINIIINKHVTLSSTYKPTDLVVPDVNHTAGQKKLMRQEAATALEQLFLEAKKNGHNLYAASGYRSYQTQKRLYKNYVKQYGQEAADTFSAKPGQSEHQLGLTMDYTSERFKNQITSAIANTPEGQWIKHNAHRFGFITRYPMHKDHITGYKYEPWHLRYVGAELATAIYLSGLTLEEYYFLVTP